MSAGMKRDDKEVVLHQSKPFQLQFITEDLLESVLVTLCQLFSAETVCSFSEGPVDINCFS